MHLFCLQTIKLEAAESKLEAEQIKAAATLDSEVSILSKQLKTQLDSLQILVEEKTSLEKALKENEKLLLDKEGKF